MLDLKSLTDGRKIIDAMYEIKMEIERQGKAHEELEKKKEGPQCDYIGMKDMDKSFEEILRIGLQQLEIERYLSVLKLIYLTLDKLLFVDYKPIDPLHLRSI